MGWTLIRLYTLLVYLFMFLPVAVVVLLSFNASQFGSFPMTGFSFRWFVELAQNEAILRAFRTSIVLGLLTALISTTLGVLASLALVRYKVPGRNLISTFLIAPIREGTGSWLEIRFGQCTITEAPDEALSADDASDD